MKNKIKGFISGVLVTSILILSIPAFAAGVNKTIDAIFNAVTVKIDGNDLNGDKISYNGKVYVDVDYVAKLIGENYKVDQSGNVSFDSIRVQTPAQEQIYKVSYNYDFETDPNENNWLVVSNPNKNSIQANWLDSKYHSAYHAVRVTGNNAGGNLKKTLPVKQGKIYKLSVWNTSENITVKDEEGGAFIAVAQLDKNGDIIEPTQKSINWENKHEWVKYNISNIEIVDGAVSIGIYLGLNGSGSVWFDDVCLEESNEVN